MTENRTGTERNRDRVHRWRSLQYMNRWALSHGKEKTAGEGLLKKYKKEEREAEIMDSMIRACERENLEIICIDRMKLLLKIPEGQDLRGRLKKCVEEVAYRTNRRVVVENHTIYQEAPTMRD